MDGADGTVMHAELRVGDSIFNLSDEMPDLGLRAIEGPRPLSRTRRSGPASTPRAPCGYPKAMQRDLWFSGPAPDGSGGEARR